MQYSHSIAYQYSVCRTEIKLTPQAAVRIGRQLATLVRVRWTLQTSFVRLLGNVYRSRNDETFYLLRNMFSLLSMPLDRSTYLRTLVL